MAVMSEITCRDSSSIQRSDVNDQERAQIAKAVGVILGWAGGIARPGKAMGGDGGSGDSGLAEECLVARNGQRLPGHFYGFL